MTTTQINLETVAAKLAETLTPALDWYIENCDNYLRLIFENRRVAIIDEYGKILTEHKELHEYITKELAVIL